MPLYKAVPIMMGKGNKELLGAPFILCYNFIIFEIWEERPLFAKISDASLPGIDGQIIDVKVDMLLGADRL